MIKEFDKTIITCVYFYCIILVSLICSCNIADEEQNVNIKENNIVEVSMIIRKVSNTSIVSKFTCNLVDKILSYKSEVKKEHPLIMLTVFNTDNIGPYIFNGVVIQEMMTIDEVNSICVPNLYYVYSLDCEATKDIILCTRVSLESNMIVGTDTVYFYNAYEPWDFLNVCKLESFTLDDKFTYYRPRSKLRIDCKVITSENELKSLL